MTAVQAAGYSKAAVRGMVCRNHQGLVDCCHREMLFYSFQYSVNFSGSSFDPLSQARGPASPLEKKTSDRFVQFCITFFQSINSNKKPAVHRV